MNYTVLTCRVTPPPIDRRAVLRYMGCRNPSDDIRARLEEGILLAADTFDHRLCYVTLPVAVAGDTVDLGFTNIRSRSLSRHLAGCTETVVMAATVGLEIDRLIARHGRLSPATGLCLQALGAERIEALCDAFCDQLAEGSRERGHTLTSRFSPGYGDLPLETQTVVFGLLDCPRRIGLTLTAGGLMSPSKSVTAFIGIRSADPDDPLS